MDSKSAISDCAPFTDHFFGIRTRFFPQWDPCNVVKTFKFVAKFYTVPCMPNLNLLALEVNRTTRG